jgi:hypothetical protein
MPCSGVDEPVHAFGDVFPQVTPNGQLDGAVSGATLILSIDHNNRLRSAIDGRFGRCTRTVMTAGTSDLS